MSVDPGDMGLPPGIGGPEKRGRSGFRTLLYVLVGLGGVLVLTCGGLALYAWQDPTVRETIGAAMASQNAPGAEELRTAGCAQAGVMDMSSAMDALLEAEGVPGAKRPIPSLFVTCQLKDETGFDCDDIARIYLAAVGSAADTFVAQVNTGGLSPTTTCQIVYSPDGTRLGSLEETIRENTRDS